MEGVIFPAILFSFLTSSRLQKRLLPAVWRSIHCGECIISYHPLNLACSVSRRCLRASAISPPQLSEALHTYHRLKSLKEGPVRGGEGPEGVGRVWQPLPTVCFQLGFPQARKEVLVGGEGRGEIGELGQGDCVGVLLETVMG